MENFIRCIILLSLTMLPCCLGQFVDDENFQEELPLQVGNYVPEAEITERDEINRERMIAEIRQQVVQMLKGEV